MKCRLRLCSHVKIKTNVGILIEGYKALACVCKVFDLQLPSEMAN